MADISNTHHTHVKPHKLTLRHYYHWYVLAVLWLVALLRFVDLQILAVLLEPIKAEMHLSDTQLSLLGGLAFALFYGSLGIPIAWLADRYNRRNIIAFAVALWSLMTALCGQANSFFTLFLGEAGAYPPSTALLADYFPEQQRGRACAVLASAIPAGVFVGFMIGGVVAQHWGWRAAFSLVGLPGVLLGLLVFTSIREPARGRLDAGNSVQAQEKFSTSLKLLLQNRAYRHLLGAACLFTLGAAGSGVWMPSFFIRHHGMSGAQIGVWMAFLYGVGGLLGSLGGGWLAEKLSNTYATQGWYARICCYSLLACLPLLPFIFLNSNPYIALGLLFFMACLMHVNTGPVLALLQKAGGSKRRATAHAISVLVSNLIALPLGPLSIGICSDVLTPVLGSGTLGLAILVLLSLSWSLAAWFFIQVARRLDAAVIPG